MTENAYLFPVNAFSEFCIIFYLVEKQSNIQRSTIKLERADINANFTPQKGFFKLAIATYMFRHNYNIAVRG